MVISYARNKRMDPCWVEPAGLPVHIVALRLLLQFHNYMEARAAATACIARARLILTPCDAAASGEVFAGDAPK